MISPAEVYQKFVEKNNGEEPEQNDAWIDEENNVLWILVVPRQIASLWSPDWMFKYMTMEEVTELVAKAFVKKE